MAIPKPDPVIKDEKLLAHMRGLPCELCGGGDNWDMNAERFHNQVHHIRHRGMGGGFRQDTPGNLITTCARCHSRFHG